MRGRTPGFALLAVGAGLVALLPVQAVLGLPLWIADTPGLVVAWLVAGYAVGALLAWRVAGREPRTPWLTGLALLGAAHVPLLLYLVVVQPDFSRGILLISLGVGGLFSLGLLGLGPAGQRRVAAFGGAALVAALALGRLTESSPGWLLTDLAARMGPPASQVEVVASVLQPLKLTRHANYFGKGVRGGGVAPLGEGYLVATGDGRLWHATRAGARGLAARALSLRVPVNPEPYLEQTPGAAPTWFRVTDLLVEERAEEVTLFAVHNRWKPDGACGVLRVSRLSAPRSAILEGEGLPEWSTLYETTPCRALETEGQGGRLVRLADGALLLSVGDHGFDGMRRPEALSQEPEGAYGKTIRIDPATGAGRIHTTGHRNPQGLHAARDGRVWLTEHGPRGGDELNGLRAGLNYGWPRVTHGRPYEGGALPSGAELGSHAGYEPPHFAWLPSIGISNLVEVRGPGLPLWRGDLVVGSLVGEALWRLRVEEERVVYAEEIPVGARVRDLVEDREGRLVLWTDDQALVFLESVGADDPGISEALRGELLFARCQGCHPVVGEVHGLGPNLRGVVGRRVASARGFPYSPALEALSGAWDARHLDAFLADPAAFAPGNRMAVAPVADADERRALIRYLESL